MAAQLSAEKAKSEKLPIIKQITHTFVGVPLPNRSSGIFVPPGAHVQYQQGENKNETDSHVVITHEPTEKMIFFSVST